MNRFRKQRVGIVTLLMVCVLLVGCSPENSVSTETVSSVQTDNELVVENCIITTNWYECSYSEAMIDVIRVEKEEGEFTGNLEFYAMLIDSEHQIFDLKYNSDQGDWTVEHEKNGGEKIPISFVMYKIPDNLSESDETTFMMAQEVVNDIVNTLKLK